MRILLASVLAATTAAAAAGQPRPEPTDWEGPAGSARPSLVATPAGELLVSWLETLPDRRTALRVAATDRGRWGEPVTVAAGDRFFVNWADFPSVVETTQGAWVVHWLEKTEAKPYAYHVRLAVSRDRGRTWGTPLTVHSDRSPTEHGFVAMVPVADGSVAIAWLDGRQMVDSGGAMSARTAVLGPDGQIRGETVLDARTCECCQLAMTKARSGLVAVYRDRTEEEVRDIAVVRQLGEKWTAPAPVYRDGWTFRACPVNGPSISARDDDLGVAWFTAAEGKPAVKVAFSSDGGGRFSAPIRADLGNPLGRLHFQMLGPSRGALVWLEGGPAAAWRLRIVDATGPRPPTTVAGAAGNRDAGFPRTAVLGRSLYVAYTESNGTAGPRVRVKKMALELH